MSSKHTRFVAALALSGLLATACKSEGSFPASEQPASEQPASEQPASEQPASEQPKAPAAKHEGVEFSWEASAGGHSGSIQATVPGGEVFHGQFHELSSTTTVESVDGFYNSWYADQWVGPEWGWDGDWPYYDDPFEYINYYTGRVVAVLEGDRGTSMRCQFQLDNATAGMKGGGQGDCQLSNGDRITAVFARS